MERKRLIRITNNSIYLTPGMSVPLSQTSLAGEHLSFRTYGDIYFEIEILTYNKDRKEISVEVLDYQPSDVQQFNEQAAKAPVRFIQFRPLIWKRIERYLSSYTKNALLRNNIVVDDLHHVPVKETGSSLTGTAISGDGVPAGVSDSFVGESNPVYTMPVQQEPVVEQISEQAKVYFKDTVINTGFIEFPYKSKTRNETFNLKIVNHFLLAEFNAIKSFFPKALGGKKQFSVNIVFTLTGKSVTDIHASSPDIDRINGDMLDSIKRERVARLTAVPLRQVVDKSLFTAEDIFDSFEEDMKDGNIFKQSEQDILGFLLENRHSRNARQLQFLAGTKHSVKHKLRFTLNPLFGFVFFIEGERKNHFCWELLNSHATYLWSFNKYDSEIAFQFRRIEETINRIRDMGRETYKRNYRNNLTDIDLNFSAIEHVHIGSALKDGFTDWQHRLSERLV